jgi:hypothetical protein
VLTGDHRRGLRQSQRKKPQFGGYRPGALRISRAGPLSQEGQRLQFGEHIHRHGRAQIRYRPLVARDDHPGRPGCGEERLQHRRVGGVVEHQQAALPVDLQPVPHRPARRLHVPLARIQATSGGHGAQGRQNPAQVLGVDPRHQPPPLLQPVSGVRRCQVRLTHAAHPGHRVHHHNPGARPGRVQRGQQVGPGLEPGRLLRDLPDHDRRILTGTGRQRSIRGAVRCVRTLLAPNEPEHDRCGGSHSTGHGAEHSPGERVHAVTIRNTTSRTPDDLPITSCRQLACPADSNSSGQRLTSATGGTAARLLVAC